MDGSMPAPAGTLFPSSKAPAPSAGRLSDQSGTSGHSLPTPRLPRLLLSEKGCASYPRLQTSPTAPGGLSGKGLRFPDGPERLLSVPPQALRIRQRQGRDSGQEGPRKRHFPQESSFFNMLSFSRIRLELFPGWKYSESAIGTVDSNSSTFRT